MTPCWRKKSRVPFIEKAASIKENLTGRSQANEAFQVLIIRSGVGFFRIKEILLIK